MKKTILLLSLLFLVSSCQFAAGETDAGAGKTYIPMSTEEVKEMEIYLNGLIDKDLIKSMSGEDLGAEKIKEYYNVFTNTIVEPPSPENFDEYSVENRGEKISKLEKLGRKVHNLFLSMSLEDHKRFGKLLGTMREVLYLGVKYLNLEKDQGYAAQWYKLHNDGVKEAAREYLNIIIGTWGSGPGEAQVAEEEGFGTAVLPDGSTYEGYFKNGLFNGRGTRVWKNGRRYEGEYKDGVPHGEGVEVWVDGTRYEGEFDEGEWHGKGTVIWKSGERFEGLFEHGIPQE